MTKQTITIHHEPAERGPLVIDHVPPLAADGCNARNKLGERVRLLCVDAPGLWPVVSIDHKGRTHSFDQYGECHSPALNIIALDGQPTEPDLVGVHDVDAGQWCLYGDKWIITGDEMDDVSHFTCMDPTSGYLLHLPVSSMVRPLAPGESLTITVTAEGER